MWLFLSTWTYNFICTLTALAMVWVYEIAAPVSWALVAPALVFDNWRLAMPDDYAEDGPHHPIWHSPDTPVWIFGALCFGILLVAPFLRFACFPTINSLIEPYFGVAKRNLAEAGGVCGKRYANIVYLYTSFFPAFSIFFVIYFAYICKRSRSLFKISYFFKRKNGVFPRSIAIVFGIVFFIAIHVPLTYIGFTHSGSRSFLPLDYWFYILLFSIFTYYPVYIIAAGSITFCYAKLNLERTND